MTSQPTRINLDPKSTDSQCFAVNTVKHELIHALGFLHEHQRPDRDGFIEVLLKLKEELLEKNVVTKVSAKNDFRLYTSYDYKSIMHYSSIYQDKTFIKPHNSHYEEMLKHQNDLSYGDILALNMHFDCQVNTRLFSSYIQDMDYNIYHELQQLDIMESAASLRSFLLFPFRVMV